MARGDDKASLEDLRNRVKAIENALSCRGMTQDEYRALVGGYLLAELDGDVAVAGSEAVEHREPVEGENDPAQTVEGTDQAGEPSGA